VPRIKKAIYIICIFILILPAAICQAEEAENPHNEMVCLRCHASDVSFEEPNDDLSLKGGDPVGLCLKCHGDIISVHHPQRVQVTVEVPDYLPVGEGNSITCLTCHYLHEKDMSAHLLRSSEIGNYKSRIDICYECHIDNFKRISPHRSEVEGMSCLICHRDTPTIKDTRDTVTLVNKNIDRLCNFCHNIKEDEHPVNVDTSIKISEKLPRTVDGKVICITCHDPHGTTGTINFLRERYVNDLEYGKYENPHNVKEYFECLKCHVEVPNVEEYQECRYEEDFILLCYTCHGADAEKCHVVNVSLSEGMTLPEGFPLNDDELISCVTCHNPDCSENKLIRYVNLDSLTKERCKDCHDFKGLDGIKPHVSKDTLSDDCFVCHNRNMAMDQFGMSQKFICLKCHKYKEHPPRTKKNVDIPSDVTGVLLDKKGKVMCTTCHDPHSDDTTNNKLKVVGEITVCEACHNA
jgi:predicted CXXCH cytochrome family protein